MPGSTHDPFTIREAAHADAPGWCTLRAALYTGLTAAFHHAEIELILAVDDKTCFLLLTGEAGTPAGFAEAALRNVVDGCLSSPVGYLEGIYVAPVYRGEGFAKALFDRVESWCAHKGCTEMGCDAELENEAAQRFHRHLGFEETYRTVGYRKAIRP